MSIVDIYILCYVQYLISLALKDCFFWIHCKSDSIQIIKLQKEWEQYYLLILSMVWAIDSIVFHVSFLTVEPGMEKKTSNIR